MKIVSKSYLLPMLALGFSTSFSATPANEPPELRGILSTGQDHRFALVATGGENTRWVSVGQSFEGWTLIAYLPEQDAVVLRRDNQEITLRMSASEIKESSAATGAKVTQAEAEQLLEKMKFDPMWDRIVDEQKKAIVSSMRQQATSEFSKIGLPQIEIDQLLDKMGNVIVSGMQADAMRQDFARIYTEVYTKDELRGMANFYDTPAGKAWSDKQPEVQQKLMQAMMPRVMQGMPAAQKLAADYLQQRATNTAPNPPAN